MALNRDSVKNYVEKFWMHPCDDGLIHSYMRGVFKVEDERNKLAKQGKLPDPKQWTAIFCPDVDDKGGLLPGKERACFIRPNPTGQEIPVHSTRPTELNGRFDVVTFHHDKGLVDCAHYVSRCLTTGGVKINQPGVDGLVATLRNLKETKTIGHKITKAQGDALLATGIMKPGDVVAYLPPKAGDDYSHSTIYMGQGADKTHRITCHTLSRHQGFYDDAPWNITGEAGWRYTLIHFGSDDTAIPPTFLAALAGWFEVSVAGRANFYRFHADGHVDRLNRRPANSRSSVTPQARGYWFVQAKEIVICWPTLGEVDRIDTAWVAPGRALPEFKLLANGFAATATAVSF